MLVFEIRAEVAPVVPPRLGDFRIFPVLALRKGVQGIHGDLLVYCRIDRLQVGHEGLQVFVGYIFAGIAQLVDNAR